MGAFLILYIVLIVYAICVRLCSWQEVNSGKIGFAYKLQAVVCVSITAITSATLSILFVKSFSGWFYQFIPAFLVAAIVAVYKK